MMEKDSALGEEYHFANCVIRSDTRELLRDGVAQKVERRSFDLILYLLKLEGRVASKDELLEHVWGNHFVSDSVIAQSIMKVRKALGTTGKEPGPIKTIHRVGYRFATEVRRALQAPPSGAPAARAAGPRRILWLPTDCAVSRAELSWVRYGLMSVASHVLHGHGVATVAASEAIRLHESMPADDIDWNAEPHTGPREIGVPTVRSRLTALDHGFMFEWWMQIDGAGHCNQVEGNAPADLALRAAREVALIVRMHSLPHFSAGQEAKFWEDAGRLVALSVSLDQTATAMPLMRRCIELPGCPLSIWAECVFQMAQQGDEETARCVQRMVALAREPQDTAFVGWAHLCAALHHQNARRTTQAVQLAMSGLARIRETAPHACLARGLLLASHVLACAGQASEAGELWSEACALVSQQPVPDMVCRLHLQRCEMDHMGLMRGAGVLAPAEGVAAARWLGHTPMGARVQTLLGVQACARGDWTSGRKHLVAGLSASQPASSTLASLFAHLQLGNLHARAGDKGGLLASLNAVQQPVLRSAPMGRAVFNWLQARRWHLDGDAVQALSSAEEALHEMDNAGIWCAEDQWLFVAQLALVAGNRRAARALLQRLQARHTGQALPSRQATALAVEGMVDYAEGQAGSALVKFEQACRLARGTLAANILLFGEAWLRLIEGRHPTPAQLVPAGQWVEATREGRFVRDTLLHKPDWAFSQRHRAVWTGTGTGAPELVVCDVGEGGHVGCAHCLPLPV